MLGTREAGAGSWLSAERQEMLAAILSGLPEPVLVAGPDDRILAANRAAGDMFGPNLAGQPLHGVLRQPEALAALDRAAATGEEVQTRLALNNRSFETVCRLTVHRCDPASAGAGLTVVSLADVGHIEEAEQIRRDFIANMSHELRSPLTVLTGFIETLKGPARNDPAAREKFLAIMAGEAQRMNRLVGDLLSLSKVEANQRVRPRDPVNLSDVLRTTVTALRPRLEDRRLTLTLDVPDPAPVVPGDRDQLIQVFHNLVENAIKYGYAGGAIEIAARVEPRQPGFAGPVAVIDVTDHGEGIDAIHIPRLTERFYRVDSHRSREMGGTGLGLAIVKHILARHRGRLTIRSVRGEGSTFSVHLPLT